MTLGRPAWGSSSAATTSWPNWGAVFDAGRSGRPTIALLLGEAGIGKTRLADEAAVIARAPGMRVLRGEADAATRERDPSLPVAERRWELLELLADALVAAGAVVVVLDDLQ